MCHIFRIYCTENIDNLKALNVLDQVHKFKKYVRHLYQVHSNASNIMSISTNSETQEQKTLSEKCATSLSLPILSQASSICINIIQYKANRSVYCIVLIEYSHGNKHLSYSNSNLHHNLFDNSSFI